MIVIESDRLTDRSTGKTEALKRSSCKENLPRCHIHIAMQRGRYAHAGHRRGGPARRTVDLVPCRTHAVLNVYPTNYGG